MKTIITIELEAGENLIDALKALPTKMFSQTAEPAAAEPAEPAAAEPAEPAAAEPAEPAAPAEPAPAGDTSNDEPLPTAEVDINNRPWDERIHSSAKTKTAKGAWKMRRGADPAIVETVEAQLDALAAPAAPPAPPAPPAAAPAPPAPPAPIEDGGGNQMVVGWTWPEILTATLTGIKDKTITANQRDDVLTALGLSEFPLLASNPDLFDAFADGLGLVK